MAFTNKKIGLVKPSETLAIKARAAELKNQGKSIVDMSTGEPDIDTPEYIKAAAVEAMKKGLTKYTAVNGIEPLREALQQKFKADNSLEFAKSQIIVCNGGKQAIYSFLQVVLEPGDQVLIPAPYWVSYPPMVELAGGVPQILQTRAEDSFKIDPAQLKQRLTSRTKVLILNSPSNPTGLAYTASELREIGEVLLAHNCLILSDEVYEKIVFGSFKFFSFAQAMPELAARTVTVNAFSKTFSMTGWRVGYAAGAAEIIDAMGRHQSQATSNVCSIAQYAALEALKGEQSFLEPLKKNYRRRIETAMQQLSAIEGVSVPCDPQGAFYLFVRFDGLREAMKRKGLNGSAQLCAYLLDQGGVATVPGEAFGDDAAFRISVGSSDQNINDGLERIRHGFSALLA